MGAEYKIVSDCEADVFAKISVTNLVNALSANGCELLSVSERDESLESYYVSLVGGGSNE